MGAVAASVGCSPPAPKQRRAERTARAETEDLGANLKCRLPKAPPASSAVDDIVGLRAGMAMKDVETFLKCRNKSYRWSGGEQTAAIEQDRLISTKTMRVASREEDIALRFTGRAGEEKLYFVMRYMNYTGENQPTFATLKQAVFDKYGTFVSAFKNTEKLEYGGQSRGKIVYGRDGSVFDRDNRLFWDCSKASNTSDEMYYKPECGLTIDYLIGYGSHSNSGYVQIYDYRVLGELVAAYEASLRDAQGVNRDRVDL